MFYFERRSEQVTHQEVGCHVLHLTLPSLIPSQTGNMSCRRIAFATPHRLRLDSLVNHGARRCLRVSSPPGPLYPTIDRTRCASSRRGRGKTNWLGIKIVVATRILLIRSCFFPRVTNYCGADSESLCESVELPDQSLAPSSSHSPLIILSLSPYPLQQYFLSQIKTQADTSAITTADIFAAERRARIPIKRRRERRRQRDGDQEDGGQDSWGCAFSRVDNIISINLCLIKDLVLGGEKTPN